MSADDAPPVRDHRERLAALEAENAALARAVIRLAVELPGGHATADQILAHQLRLGLDDAALIVTAAQRTG
jgi:hypothetical protein